MGPIGRHPDGGHVLAVYREPVGKHWHIFALLPADKLEPTPYQRGIRHPFVKNYVLARTTPLTRQRKTLPSFDQTFTKLRPNVEAFDVAAVRYEDVQRSSLMSAAPASE